MRVLLDEHLSPLIARSLRDRGLDAVSVSERDDLRSVSDAELMEVAAAEARAVVTNNIGDFRPIAASLLASGQHHGGLILIPSRRTRTRAATGQLAAAVAAIMAEHAAGIPDSEHWIAPLTP